MNQLQYMHFRNIKGGKIHSNGGATVAFKIGKDGRVEKYAMALCSDNDNYSRALGRNLAGGRLQHPAFTHRPEMNESPESFRRMIEASMKERGLSRPFQMYRRPQDHRPRAN